MRFKSPNKNYVKGNFKSAKRPKSPNPIKPDFEQKALKKSNHSTKCGYIHPETNRRCKIKLGIYPRYCHLHTLLIENLCVSKSAIKNGGNGLFAGAFSFKKGDIIGEYSKDWTKGSSKRMYSRNGKDADGEDKPVNSSYIYCDNDDRYCWDSLDLRTTIVRFANDAHGSKFKNNAYFEEKKDKNGKNHVYVYASQKIQPYQEIFLDYGDDYF